MSDVAYYTEFGRPNYREMHLNRVKVSNYFPPPMVSALYDPSIPKDSYIVCPVYKGVGDTQIGVTGASHLREDPVEGITRELAEELGIVPVASSHLVMVYEGKNFIRKKGKPPGRGVNWNVFLLNLSKTDLIPVSREIRGVDTKTRKVGCLVYGTENRVKKVFEKVIIPYISEDQIKGIMAVPHSFAIKALANKRAK